MEMARGGPAEVRPTAATLVPARFVARPNRFIVHAVSGEGAHLRCHLADPGRLSELLVAGAELRLRAAPPDSNRATEHTVALVRAESRTWVSVEATRANDLAEQLLSRGRVRGTGPVRSLRREVRSGNSRFDFLLRNDVEPDLWVEVKSVTWAERGSGRFPDAPTARGRRHVEELIEKVDRGDRAMVLFVAQRGDVRVVAPFREIDPEFARVLRRARQSGVLLRAARFRLGTDDRARYAGPVPVRS
jgi:sugar fermentation stimulation protein A